MSVKDLISAIASGSAIDTQTAFNQVMAEKISAKLDDMRVEVAQNMFATESVDLEEEQLNEITYSAPKKCPHCGTHNKWNPENEKGTYHCKDCGSGY
jgi:tRNA(Ile2) C34 agmatinyltransferase TiaS